MPWLLQTLGAQQSAVLEQAVPAPAQPHVPVFVSQRSEPQQSALLAQPWPPIAQPHTPFRQTPLQQSLPVEHESPSAAQLPPVPPSPPDPLLSTHLPVLASHV